MLDVAPLIHIHFLQLNFGNNLKKKSPWKTPSLPTASQALNEEQQQKCVIQIRLLLFKNARNRKSVKSNNIKQQMVCIKFLNRNKRVEKYLPKKWAFLHVEWLSKIRNNGRKRNTI